MSESSSLQILLVEDNPADADLFLATVEMLDAPAQVHVVADGELALAFLRRAEPYASAPEPDLVLLDLNLPRMNGRAVLTELRRDPELRRLRVIVFTSSDAPADVRDAYDLDAAAYLRKPRRLAGYKELVSALIGFWGLVLPPR